MNRVRAGTATKPAPPAPPPPPLPPRRLPGERAISLPRSGGWARAIELTVPGAPEQGNRRARRAQARLLGAVEVLRTNAGDGTSSEKSSLAALRDVVGALETLNGFKRGHAKRVRRHAERTARALGCDPEEVADVRLAAQLHDVGKLQVPQGLLLRRGPLTGAEWERVKSHAKVGAEVVTIFGRRAIEDAVRHHHERWDGRGYPEGAEGDDIPLAARIIAVADAYDALISRRPHRDRSGSLLAVNIMRKEAGKQFDPQVLEAFLSTLPRRTFGSSPHQVARAAL